MPDRQVLMQQLLNFLESTPDLPEYLAQEPDTVATFDPYQMVSEWIALRQEMKQQGKLLQAAQDQLQRELEAARSHNDQLQQQLLTAQTAPKNQDSTPHSTVPKDQESFLRNLLNVMDALDRALAHWQEQAALVQTAPPSKLTRGLRNSLAHWLMRTSHRLSPPPPPPITSIDLLEVLQSDRQGIDLIRQNLLELLQKQQVTPMESMGQPFDARCMFALGRQTHAAPPGTVIQEVVRGYWWGDRILREAQVIVSAGTANPTTQI